MYETLVSFFVANGYGVYIWPCYVLLLALISWQLIMALKKNSIVRKNIAKNLQLGLISDKQT